MATQNHVFKDQVLESQRFPGVPHWNLSLMLRLYSGDPQTEMHEGSGLNLKPCAISHEAMNQGGSRTFFCPYLGFERPSVG